MYRENICHLDVQGGFRSCVQIVEFINVELDLGMRNRNYCMTLGQDIHQSLFLKGPLTVIPNISETLNRIPNVAIQRL